MRWDHSSDDAPRWHRVAHQQEESSMKKAIFAALLGPASALAAIAPAASADSPWTRVTDPLESGTPNGPLVDPAGSFCSFDLVISVVANHELQRQFPAAPPAPANATETDTQGALVLNFANTDANVAVTRNVSGTIHSVAYVDSAGNLQTTQTGSGNNWWTFGPHGRKNTGLPGAFISSGPYVLHGTGNVVNSFQAQHITDVCRLLGGTSAPPAP
jgi:hypothetical protein